MKYKHIILFAAFALIASVTSAQIQFTAGINYESGVPSGAPSSTGSRLRVDLASGRIYQWSAANSTWRTLGQGIDIVAGCAAPAYTPGYAQSAFAVNGCSTPELYYYNGTQWKQVAGGGGGGATYYAGTGIDIDANDTISIDTVPRLIFYSNQTYSGGVGAMRWNSDDGTLDLGLKGGNVTLQLGQELVQPVKHATNGGLDNGKVVYITGSSGDNKTVLYARANNEATSANTLGLMTETVTGGNKGFCTTFGLVRNINTSNLTEGGAVWLSKDTAGAMTAVRPTAPNHAVFIGFCVRKHASVGVIFVNVQNGYEINELHNVYAPSPTNGQVLTYVSANSRWEAATVADQSATNELQTLSVATNTATLSNSGGSVTIAGGGINSASTAGSTITVTGTEVDGSTTNELQTLSVATNTATLSNSGGSVTIAGGGINTVGTAGSTITVTGTEVDGSVTNEIQQIDTFSLSGQTLRASLSNDNQAPSTVTLPVVGITAGTNVTVSSTGGNFTINATGGSGITSLNGLTAATQTFATGTAGADFNLSSATSTHTFNLPTASATNRGALSSADWTTFNNKVGGSGTATRVAFWSAGSTLSSNANLYWDNTNSRLGVQTTTPTAPLDVGSTAIALANIRLSGATGNSIPDYSSTGFNPPLGTTTCFFAAPFGSTVFGAQFSGFSTSSSTFAPLNFNGYIGANTSITWPAMRFNGWKHDGATNRTALTGSEIIVAFAVGLTTDVMNVRANANTQIGGSSFSTDSGYRLDVNANSATTGAVRIRGAGTTGLTALLVQNNTPSTLFQILDNGSTTLNGTLAQNGTVTMSDGSNIVVGSTNGTKIGTATTQKIGFYNATPIARPDTGVAASAFVAGTGTAVNDNSTFGGYTIKQVVQALQNLGLLA